MDEFLSLSVDRRRLLCETAGSRVGLNAASVEKDYWVCWTLRELFALPGWGERLTFKGGTSLSKGWNLIDRFSEDIDVVVDREALGFGGAAAPEHPGISGKDRDRRLNELKSACRAFVQGPLRAAFEARVAELSASESVSVASDPDDSDDQTLLFRYPQSIAPGAYLRPEVKIELGARSDVEPNEMPEIRPYLDEVTGRGPKASAFRIRTVAPERTFWEKAMLLHEERLRSGTFGPKLRLSRHYYDVFRLLRAGVGARAAADIGLFDRVAAHRSVYFPKSKAIRDSLKRGTLRLVPERGLEAAWREDYEKMRDVMFFSEPPTFDEILREVAIFETSFNGG